MQAANRALKVWNLPGASKNWGAFSGIGLGGRRFGFSAFLEGYIEAALFSSTADSGGYEEPLDVNYGPDDIAPATRKKMESDAKRFWDKLSNEHDLDMDDRRAGQMFWYSRNGHGTGFWDEPGGALGDRLHKIAKSFGEYNLYIGDDGKIHGT